LRLTAYAATTCELDEVSRLLLERGRLKPAFVLINVALKMLAHSETYRKSDIIDVFDIPARVMLDRVRKREFINLEKGFETQVCNWVNTLFPDRIKINYRLNSRLVRARMTILEACAQGIVADFAPSPSPWAEEIPPEDRERPLSEVLALA